MDLRRWTIVAFSSVALSACKTTGSFGIPQGAGTSNGNLGASVPAPAVPTTPVVTTPIATAPAPTTEVPAEPSIEAAAKDYPLLWETARKDAKPWTTVAYEVIENENATDFMPGASDVTDFCPKYLTLTNHQRANFWGLLVSAVVKYESGFDPTSRMAEPSLGIDSVTKQTVESEGLLQLSYGDANNYSFCDFDWSIDKKLAATDPKKTILDPKKNLVCGIKILANQLRKQNKIAVTTGVYWSTLVPGGKYGQVTNIKSITKKMTGCQ